MPFKDYDKSKFVPYLLPIIPAKATLSPTKTDLTPEHLGKIPGRRREDGWVGFGGWQNNRATDRDLVGFDKMYEGTVPTIGIQASNFPAADIDIKNKPIVDAIMKIAREELGDTIIRGRPNSAKARMMYRAAEGAQLMRKIRHAYQNVFTEEKGALEWLAHGQQYLIEGMHPTNVPYDWGVLGFDPLTWGFDSIPTVTGLFSSDQVMG